MKRSGITEWKWYNSKYKTPEKSMKCDVPPEVESHPPKEPMDNQDLTDLPDLPEQPEQPDLELKYTRMNRKDLKSIQRDNMQLHQNPYFSNHNYIDDLKNEDLFLRPKNSHDEKSI